MKENIESKRDHKKTMYTESPLYKLLGVEIFQDYIIPTNPSTRNKIYKILRFDKFARFLLYDASYTRSKHWRRVALAYINQMVHLGIGSSVLTTQLQDGSFDIHDAIIQLLGTVYPILVQQRVRRRLFYILRKRSSNGTLKASLWQTLVESVNK